MHFLGHCPPAGRPGTSCWPSFLGFVPAPPSGQGLSHPFHPHPGGKATSVAFCATQLPAAQSGRCGQRQGVGGVKASRESQSRVTRTGGARAFPAQGTCLPKTEKGWGWAQRRLQRQRVTLVQTGDPKFKNNLQRYCSSFPHGALEPSDPQIVS